MENTSGILIFSGAIDQKEKRKKETSGIKWISTCDGKVAQPAISSSEVTIETLEQYLKYVQS